jgi:hypothetical protein
MIQKKHVPAVAGLGAMALVVACGGGGGGGGTSEAVEGLEGPETMSVVTTEESGSAAQISPQAVEDFAIDAEYFTDMSKSHVFDPSMKVLSTVNEILCMLGQTAYRPMVNQGPYIAQVNEALCGSGGDESSSDSGQSSGGDSEEFKNWVVDSSRTDNDSDHSVHVWVPQGDNPNEPAATIRVNWQIQQGVSDVNPFGVFNLDFAGVADDGGDVADPLFFGTLETLDVLDGFLGFSFYEDHGDPTVDPGEFGHAEVISANVNMFDDQSQGVARVQRTFRENFPPMGDSGMQVEEFLIAYDQDHVLRNTIGEGETCLSRTAFHENVWRYNLYYASGDQAGMRVERNGGFPVETEDGEHGYAGYYGIHFPPQVTLENGATLIRNQFGSAPETYTLLQAPGKLIEHTRSTLPLTEIVGETFEWFYFENSGPGGPPPELLDGPGPGPGSPPTQYRLEYTEGLGFVKVATFDPMEHEWVDLEEPEALDTSEVGFLNMYSQSLGGSVSYVHGNEYVTYFSEQFVNGASTLFDGDLDGLVDLYGYTECLRAGIEGSEAESGNIFQEKSFDVAEPYHYQFGQDDLTLNFDTNGDGSSMDQVGLVDGATIESGPFTWGMHSGPLITDTSELLNVFEMYNQEVFYTYETGPNDWNTYSALLDGEGAPVVFDPPLQFTYEHSEEADRNGESTYAGKKYFLNYGGPGDLHGIPSEPVDFNNDGNFDRWYPIFGINDGTLMGETGVEYVVKAMEIEQTLQETPGECGLLTTGPVADLALPDGTSYEAPAIGEKPVVTDPPAVVAGEVQEGVLPE